MAQNHNTPHRKRFFTVLITCVAVVLVASLTVMLLLTLNKHNTQKTDIQQSQVSPEENLSAGKYDEAKAGFQTKLSEANASGDSVKAEYYKQQLDFIDATPKELTETPPQEPTVETHSRFGDE